MPSVYRRRAVGRSSSGRRNAVVVMSSGHRASVVIGLITYRHNPPVAELLLPLENLVCMCLEFSYLDLPLVQKKVYHFFSARFIFSARLLGPKKKVLDFFLCQGRSSIGMVI